MTTLHDADLSAADAATDSDNDLDLPAALEPRLTLSDGVLEVAYTYYTGDLEPDSKAARHARHAYDALLTTVWTITDAGALEITGSDGTTTYVVDTSVCVIRGAYRMTKKGKVSQVVCKGWQFSGGTCYHRIAFELLRIAQVFEAF